MRLGMSIAYATDPMAQIEAVPELERAGIDMVWVAEAYGLDAVSVMGYLAAITETVDIASGILPIFTRTPSLLAQTAVGLDTISGGRFILGLGASGPQVVEGWHGVEYSKPIRTIREVIEICRNIWAREGPLTYDGEVFTLPLGADRGTGLGKPLKIINHPKRPDIPILLATLGPKSVEMTAELANEWLPVFFVPEKAGDVWGADLARGLDKRQPELGPLGIVAGGPLAIGPEAEVAKYRDIARPTAALYIGGMGAKGRNFYNDIVCKYGWESEAQEIQQLYLDGHREDAMAAVPDELLASTSLIGDEGYVRERIEAYREAGVTTLSIAPVGADPVATVAKLREIVG